MSRSITTTKEQKENRNELINIALAKNKNKNQSSAHYCGILVRNRVQLNNIPETNHDDLDNHQACLSPTQIHTIQICINSAMQQLTSKLKLTRQLNKHNVPTASNYNSSKNTTHLKNEHN